MQESFATKQLFDMKLHRIAKNRPIKDKGVYKETAVIKVPEIDGRLNRSIDFRKHCAKRRHRSAWNNDLIDKHTGK